MPLPVNLEFRGSLPVYVREQFISSELANRLPRVLVIKQKLRDDLIGSIACTRVQKRIAETIRARYSKIFQPSPYDLFRNLAEIIVLVRFTGK